jgi:hypothetical protein
MTRVRQCLTFSLMRSRTKSAIPRVDHLHTPVTCQGTVSFHLTPRCDDGLWRNVIEHAAEVVGVVATAASSTASLMAELRSFRVGGSHARPALVSDSDSGPFAPHVWIIDRR